jgi:hypothetical protein
MTKRFFITEVETIRNILRNMSKHFAIEAENPTIIGNDKLPTNLHTRSAGGEVTGKPIWFSYFLMITTRKDIFDKFQEDAKAWKNVYGEKVKQETSNAREEIK